MTHLQLVLALVGREVQAPDGTFRLVEQRGPEVNDVGIEIKGFGFFSIWAYGVKWLELQYYEYSRERVIK